MHCRKNIHPADIEQIYTLCAPVNHYLFREKPKPFPAIALITCLSPDAHYTFTQVTLMRFVALIL